MFGIGSGELLIIAVVALIVLGPERLPKAARFAGLWVRRARTQWHSVKAELERELEAEELKRSVQDAQRSIADVGTQLRDAQSKVRDEFDAVRRGADELADEARRVPDTPAVTEAPLSPPPADEAEMPALPPGAIAADPTTPPRVPQEAGDGAAR
ncbi:Sec-independent protein translocase protein TatB [Luteimonas sp. S4-F44]|uniref:Sec-independent protein translocase protein TatB n=1 Tax=Luteimonas sp. S4-F44 TaxID=2925842 RepID=UPI001F533435|nr:Sec-independent protein translocase protein TatB [Luteimonas sp. S4-F44]UNK42337.1 Sec-independent protein translocase protein TatB [Luteimonas sp. S4-F44]